MTDHDDHLETLAGCNDLEPKVDDSSGDEHLQDKE